VLAFGVGGGGLLLELIGIGSRVLRRESMKGKAFLARSYRWAWQVVVS
jgi:hypothetical protein